MKFNRTWMFGLSMAAVAVVMITVVSLVSNRSMPQAPGVSDWKSNWVIEKGFDITIDSHGFEFPTAIAFVPNPGNSAKSPLYFVSELEGQVKVVTNDRTVFTFAEDFVEFRPSYARAMGLAGICLAPKHGYVFVTFSYHDSDNILRNNIVRFQTTPDKFSTTPNSQTDFTEVFAPYRSAPSHQIGPCQVHDEFLYVSVADGSQTEQSLRMDSLLGKTLRMTLDGLPAPNNPFYQNSDTGNAQNYIWAYGLRNPFGLNIVDGRVFVADNGLSMDRFLEVEEGGNYLWDGTDTSIGSNADAVFYPGDGVAQLDHYKWDSDLFPNRFKDNFFLMMTGHPEIHLEAVPAIWAIPYDFSQGKLSGVSTPLVRYQGKSSQVASALAFGPDGLYFAPLTPNDSGLSQVLKISYDPESQYPYTLDEEINPIVLTNTHGCLACHSLGDKRGGTVGPNLDRDLLVPRLEQRLNSAEYTHASEQLDQLDSEPFISFVNARKEVLQAQGIEKIRTWLYYRILEPRFDNPGAEMPKTGLSDSQAKSVADFLLATKEETSRSRLDIFKKVVKTIENRLPYPTRENARIYGASLFLIGFFAAILTSFILFRFAIYRRRKTQNRTHL